MRHAAKRWGDASVLAGWFLLAGIMAGCSGNEPMAPAPGADAGNNVQAGGTTAVPPVTGHVFRIVPDGGGGLYIGGQFTQVGTVDRRHLAHILSDGQVDGAWAPEPDGPITAMLLNDQGLYVGGSFFTIAGQPRAHLAALDRTSGAATAWDPSAFGTSGPVIHVLLGVGSTMYVGGLFDLLNADLVPGQGVRGASRPNLGAVDTVTGRVTPWNPMVRGEVFTLAPADTTLYIGGSFDFIGGLPAGQPVSRANLAAVDLSSGLATTWNPTVRGQGGDVVYRLTVSGQQVLVGGIFAEVAGQPRTDLAVLDRDSGLSLALALNPDGAVYDIFETGDRLYVAGDFTHIGGQSRERVAAVEKSTGQLTGWNPGADALVRTLIVLDNIVYMGGDFSTVAGRPRTGLAAVDATSGTVLGN